MSEPLCKMNRRHALVLTSSLTAGVGTAAWGAAMPPPLAALRDTLAFHAQLVLAGYEDSLSSLGDLRDAVARFVAAPSADGLLQCQQAWTTARHWYGQTEAFRFSDGPIDDEHGPEPRINTWPLDESFIDAVRGQATAGFINDRTLALSREVLVGLNEQGGETHISCGWHAIEFLLWGQDERADAPGQRPYTDFVDGRAPNADCRRQALVLMVAQLYADLDSVRREWAADQPNYRQRFESGGLESLRKLLVGLGTLIHSELAGERLEVALASQNQEDEQSCFSDTTHRDVIANVIGLRNVWLGQFVRRDGQTLTGPSPSSLLAQAQPKLAKEMNARLDDILTAAKALQPPFDQEIQRPEGQARIRRLIQLLRAQARAILAAAKPLGIAQLNLIRRGR